MVCYSPIGPDKRPKGTSEDKEKEEWPGIGGPALEWVLAVEFALENRASKQKI